MDEFAFLILKTIKEVLCMVLIGFVINILFQGLDLSPYFLAVAQHKEKRAMPRKIPVRWIHANGEDTGLPSKSFDLVSLAFVVCFFFSL